MPQLNPSRYKNSNLVNKLDSYSFYKATRVTDDADVSVWSLPVVPETVATITAQLEKHGELMATHHPTILDYHSVSYMPADDCLLLELEEGCYETFAEFLVRLQEAGTPVSEQAIWEVIAQLSQAIAYCYNPLNNLSSLNWSPMQPGTILRTDTGHIKLFNPVPMKGILSAFPCPQAKILVPPECAGVADAEPTQAAAVWFIGRLAWCLADPQELVTAPQSLSADRKPEFASYSSDFNRLVLSCTALDPKARPTATEITTFSPVIKATSSLQAQPTPLESSMTQPPGVLGLFSAIYENSVDGFNRHKAILGSMHIKRDIIERAVGLCINLKRSSLLSIICECIAEFNIRVRLKDFVVESSNANNVILSPRNSLFVTDQRESVSSFSLAEKTSLMNAATAGNRSLVEEFLYEAGKQNTYGKTALMMAAEAGHKDCVKLLLVEAGYVDLENKTALYYAYVGFNAPYFSYSNRESLNDRGSFRASFQNTSVASSMMPSLTNPFASGAGSISQADRYESPAHREDREACIAFLYNQEKDIVADDGTTLLMLLAEANCKKGVAALKDLQGMQDSFGRTALTRGLACGANYDTLLPLLADERELPLPEETALTYAIREGFLEGVRQLIPSLSGVSNKTNLTPIEVARSYGRLDCEELLLAFEWQTKSSLDSEHLQNLIERQIYAVRNGNKEVVERLSKIIGTYWPKYQVLQTFRDFEFPAHYAEIVQLCPETLDAHLSSVLNLALKEHRLDALPHICERIVTRKTRVTLVWHDAEETAEATPLINAALNKDETELKNLLKHSFNVVGGGVKSSTIVELLEEPKGDTFKLIQSATPPSRPSPPSLMDGVDLTSMIGKAHNGMTALGAAASAGSVKCLVLLLVELGAVPKNGMTALMYAAKFGHRECVRMLLVEAGQANSEGCTALILAAKYGHADCVELLKPLEGRIRDRQGKTALQWAMEKPYKGSMTWGATDASYEVCIAILSTNK